MYTRLAVAARLSLPTKPCMTGSIRTMSPVATARSFNRCAATLMHHVKHDSSPSDTIDSPTVAPTSTPRPKAAVRPTTVSRAALLDARHCSTSMMARRVREILLDDLIRDELPEYIQVYLTPHPNREGFGAKGAFGDEEVSKKEAEAEYERCAAKRNDVEVALLGYKSTPSFHRAPAFGPEVPEETKCAPKCRHCIAAKTSTRILCLVILLMALLVVPFVIFGVGYNLELKGKHNNSTAVAPDQKASPSAQAPAFEPNHPGIEITDGPPVDVPPIVAPITTTAVGKPVENQVAVGDGN